MEDHKKLFSEFLKNCLFDHDVIDITQVPDGGRLTMVNNGTGYCNMTLINIEKRVLLKDFWTDSADAEIIFVVDNQIVFGFTKVNMRNLESKRLNIGIQHFSVPPRKSFTVIIDRIHVHPNNLTIH